MSISVWGWDSGRIRELGDELAAEGHLVLIPKLLQPPLGGTDGDGLPPDFDIGARGADFGPWVTQILWSKLEPQVNALLDDLQRVASQRSAAWAHVGARATFHLSTGRIVCGVNCHPSVGLEAMMGGSDMEVNLSFTLLISAAWARPPQLSLLVTTSNPFTNCTLQLADTVQCPMMMLPAGGDPDNTKPGGEMNQLFDTKSFGADCRYQEFPEMEHGWVPRGDTSDERVARDVKAAMELAKGYQEALGWC